MAQLVKVVDGLAIASVKTFDGLAIASAKTIMGLDNTSGGQTVTDDFNRADSADLGANWTPVTDSFGIVSNSARPNNSNNDACERYSGVTWTANQSSQVKVTTTGTSAGAGGGVSVRCSTVAETHYRLVINADGEWELIRFVAGAATVLASGTATYASGAILKLSAIGTTITSTYNGSQIDTRTDAVIATGQPGVAYSSSSNDTVLDDWSGSDGL